MASAGGAAAQSNVGIFTKGKTCVLTFAGTNNADDMDKDLEIDAKPFCAKVSGASDRGWMVHQGFLEKTQGFMEGQRFQEFSNFLSDRGTCEKVVVAGHSMGGAVADLVAACTNKTHAADAQHSFKADFLFTFGAPGVSKDVQLDNAGGGCFPGARLYNSEDPVPGLASAMGFFHPKVKEIRMDGGDVQTWTCNDASRKNQPELPEKDDSEAHKMSFHLQRMKTLQKNGGKDTIFDWKMENF